MGEVLKRALLIAAAGAALAACAAPAYTIPQLSQPLPKAYKEAGPWTPAEPADAAPHGEWWTAFNDATLNRLAGQLLADNQTLAEALARYDQANAYFAQVKADRFPQVGVAAARGPQQLSAARPGGGGKPLRNEAATFGAVFSYELDLWGRVRNEVAAGKADAEASAADLAATRLSLEAQLADAYLSVRSLDAQGRVLGEAAASYQKALDLTRLRHSSGAASGLDVGQAETQLKSAEAARTEAAAQRALLEHAIASLVGVPASSFSLAIDDELPSLPLTPAAAPSALLQRRPDIAAAERRAFAANRRIGVARAAFFPTVTLNGSGGLPTVASNPRVSKRAVSRAGRVGTSNRNRIRPYRPAAMKPSGTPKGRAKGASTRPATGSGLTSRFVRQSTPGRTDGEQTLR